MGSSGESFGAFAFAEVRVLEFDALLERLVVDVALDADDHAELELTVEVVCVTGLSERHVGVFTAQAEAVGQAVVAARRVACGSNPGALGEFGERSAGIEHVGVVFEFGECFCVE